LVIIPAGGIGSRMGLPYPKQLARFGDTTVIEKTVSLFIGARVVVPVPADWLGVFEEKLAGRAEVIAGGPTRYESVRLGFEALGGLADDDLVLIHDAARPFLDPATLPAAWSMAAEKGAVIYGAAAVDTLKQVDATGRIEDTLDRRRVFHAMTPQIFAAGLLRTAYAAHDAGGGEPPTDEAMLLEQAGIPVHIFPATHANRKLTHKEDLALLTEAETRIGHGYDVHRYDEGRPLFLGGIEVPGGPGLAGHSDADVAIHALIDALLGAAGLGDIGKHFPDTDPALEGIRSTELLTRTWSDLRARGYGLGNADITICAQVPRLAPHIEAMRARLAELLGCEAERVNIKATTTERLGFVGRKEGMSAHAVAILRRERS